MTRAELALLIAIGSALVAVGSLAWQIVLYRLAGPRLAVHLIPAVLDSEQTLVRGPEQGFGPSVPDEIVGVLSEWTVDLAEIQVANIGRVPLSLSEISLDLGRQRRFGRQRYTVRGVPVVLHGGRKEETIRLEAGENASVLYDFWPLLKRVRDSGKKWISVRASVQPAGRQRKRSSWFRRWVVEVESDSLRPDFTVTPHLRAYQALWRTVGSGPNRFFRIQLAWHWVRKTLNDSTTVEDVAGALEQTLGPAQRVRADDVVTAFRANEPL